MNINKDHWYDGWFYDTFIAPNQDKLFNEIKNLIELGSRIIDIGCGTGRFSFTAADKCNSILGIDLSKRNIDRALLKLSKNPDDKISFMHSNVRNIISTNNNHFDYAVMTFVIHELNERQRINLLNEIMQITDKIIIGDYLVPKPSGLWSRINEVVEYAAGSDHYKNYKNFVHNGGIRMLADKTGFKIEKETLNKPSTSHLAVLSKT